VEKVAIPSFYRLAKLAVFRVDPFFYRLKKLNLFLVVPFFMGEKTAKMVINSSSLSHHNSPTRNPYKFKGINTLPLILNVNLGLLVRPF